MGSTYAPERRAPCPRDPRHRVEGSRRRRPGRPAGRRAQFRQRGGEFARKDDDARPCADDAMSPTLGRGTAATRCSAAAAPAAGAGDTATPRRRDAQRSNTRFAPNADYVDRVAKRWMTLLIDETSATRRADPLRRIPDNRCHPLLNRCCSIGATHRFGWGTRDNWCHPPFGAQSVPPTVLVGAPGWGRQIGAIHESTIGAIHCSISATHCFGWGIRLGAPGWSHPRIGD